MFLVTFLFIAENVHSPVSCCALNWVWWGQAYFSQRYHLIECLQYFDTTKQSFWRKWWSGQVKVSNPFADQWAPLAAYASHNLIDVERRVEKRKGKSYAAKQASIHKWRKLWVFTISFVRPRSRLNAVKFPPIVRRYANFSGRYSRHCIF